MKIKRLVQDVVAFRILETLVSPGGIHLRPFEKPEAGYCNEVLRGEVVAVGPGLTLKSGKVRPVDVEPGDRIQIHNHNYTDPILGDIRFTREEFILGVEE